MKQMIGVVLIMLLTTAIAVNAADYGMEKAAAQKDIVDTAVAAGSFNTLVAAVQAAGLVETLKGKGPFTVFAPTDEAFAKIPKATLDALLKDKKNLTAVLTYHVVQGNVTSSDLKNGMSVKTVEGQTLSIDTTNGVMVNNAKVVKANIMATNGVIHVIDTVLMPPTATSKAAPTNTPGFEAAFSVAGLLAVAFIALKRRS